MDATDILNVIASMIETSGLAVALILAGAWFFNRRVWPLIERAFDAWIESQREDRIIMRRAVDALDRIADAITLETSSTPQHK